jgi:hypothetical protein
MQAHKFEDTKRAAGDPAGLLAVISTRNTCSSRNARKLFKTKNCDASYPQLKRGPWN